MLQQLVKYFIFINIILLLSILPSDSRAEDIFNNLDSIDTADEIINILEEKDNFISDPAAPSNNPSAITKNLELKNCSSGKIIALNKITAASKELLLQLNQPQYFGNIQIKLHKCLKNLDPYNEDTYMLLTVTEHKIDEDPSLIFQGWLISSSISLSNFEHPIYELFAKECL